MKLSIVTLSTIVTLSVLYKPYMPSIIMLNVVMLCAMAPVTIHSDSEPMLKLSSEPVQTVSLSGLSQPRKPY